MTTREIIFAHRNSTEVTSMPVPNAHQMQSVIMKRKDAQYVQFLMNYIKLAPRRLTNEVTEMILGFLNEKYESNMSNTGYVNAIIRQKLDFTFDLAFEDSSVVNLTESNKKNNLIATYIDLMIASYERELGKFYTHIISTISTKDDIEEVPSEFEIYDFQGKYTCISRESPETTEKLLNMVLTSSKKNEAA
ncbi:MAG: hypothetical protein QM504_03480 [Pseudomonadota bacterium]